MGGKGKKGKGKGKRAASLDSPHWERKLEDENRMVLGDKTYTGVISRYIFKNGFGFILPDKPQILPKKVKAKLAEVAAEAEEAGKEINPNELYFRKPDVNHEDGFSLRDDTPCTFKVYV